MPDPVDEFLSRCPADIQAITNRLRRLVARAAPRAKEVLYARGNHFGYSLSGRTSEQVLYVLPMPDYVRLGFFWGGHLPDPRHLLVGDGKRLRHIKLRSLKEAGDPAIQALIKAAWADARARRKQTLSG